MLADLLGSPLASALLEVGRGSHWSGSPADLHAELTEVVGKSVTASAGWPKGVEKFGRELRRLAPQLRLHGINVQFERRHAGRVIRLTAEPTSSGPARLEE